MSSVTPAGVYSRTNPYAAPILENYLLTKQGSEKETCHITIEIKGSDLTYKPGDSLGVFPQNTPETVEQVLKLLNLDPNFSVQESDGKTWSLREALTKGYVLNRANKKFVKILQEKLPQNHFKDQITALIADDAKLTEYIYDRDVVDVLLEFPGATIEPAEFLAQLQKIAPRLYSIASSPDYCPGQVHLTVAVVQYETHGRKKIGLASGWLGHYAKPGAITAPVFIQSSKHFHLPEDSNTPMIMVGPGTGIAPFRAFLQHRAKHGHKGKNWLFFGEQHRATDYFYEEEFNGFLRDGVLTRIDTAFSRDQDKKVYVQDRMRENSAEIWSWIDAGAYFYVCGDAKRMAKDVHQTLIEIAEKHGNLSRDAATEYVEIRMIKTEKRYLRDVY